MSYSEQSSEVFTHFTDEEDRLIQTWLTDHGYEWSHNTVCGNCCGMYEDEYWVNGIGGDFKKQDRDEFKEYATKEGIDCLVNGYTIAARAYDE